MRTYPVFLLAIILLISVSFIKAQQNTGEKLYQEALFHIEGTGDYTKAIELLNRIVKEHADNKPLASRALLKLGISHEKLGEKEAETAYRRIIEEYSDQREVVLQARSRLLALAEQSRHFNPSGVIARQVWAPAYDISGSISPDGRRISYAHWETGDLGIYDFESRKSEIVTSEGSWGPNRFAYYSAWSRDPNLVAYSWFEPNSAQLRVISVGENSEPRIIYSSSELEYIQPFDWMPDNRAILVLIGHKDHTNEIAIIDVNNGKVRGLKSLDWRTTARMSLSPDGRYIAYDMAPDENSSQRDIYLLTTDGSRDIKLVEHPASDYAPVWSPDGSKILFASNRMGTVGLWLLEIQNGNAQGSPQLVQQDLNRLLPLGFSNDGVYYYARTTMPYQNTGDIYVAEFNPEKPEIALRVDKVSKSFEGVNSLPEWSPDGRYLAYVSQRGPLPGGWGARVLVIQDMENSTERILLPRLARFSLPLHNPPRWSHDGRLILISGADHKNRLGFYLLDVETSEVKMIFSNEKRRQQGNWASDGSEIYFLEWRKGNTSIINWKLETGEERELYNGHVHNLTISPDGRMLGFANEEEILVMPVNGEEPRIVFRVEEENCAIPREGGLAWTPDNRYIIFVSIEDGLTRVWKLDIENGNRTSIHLSDLEDRKDLFVSKIRHITLSSDGKRLAFSYGSVPSEVWVLENLLHGSNTVDEQRY
jgi:Tol biopolymer transport system component